MSVPATARGRDAEAGFTLLEALIALAIVGAAALIALPLIGRAADPGRLRAEASAIAAAARSARADAIRTGRERVLVVDVAARAWRTDADAVPRRLDARLAIDADVPPAERAAAGERRIRFLASGASSGGTIRLGDGRATASVEIDWLTGGARASVAP